MSRKKDNYIPTAKKSNKTKKSKKISLQERLDRIYNSVDLSTECDRKLCCCKTACPSMNECEFNNIIVAIWDKASSDQKLLYVCKSIEYFFKNEYSKYGKEIFVKPCLLLNLEEKACSQYPQRPLSCRMYGLWPKSMYDARVDKFEKAYSELGLTRADLPLNEQCPYVKKSNKGEELTEDIINTLYSKLDAIDLKMGNFSQAQIAQKSNYRTFHDWLLLKIFGEQWLIAMTDFMMMADREKIDDLMRNILLVAREKFAINLPAIIPDIKDIEGD